MTELHAVATIPAKAGSEDTVRSALTTLAAATLAEEGCLAYDLFESASSPGTYVTIERWTDPTALGEHLATDHVAAAFAAVEGHLAGEVAVHPLAPVD